MKKFNYKKNVLMYFRSSIVA